MTKAEANELSDRIRALVDQRSGGNVSEAARRSGISQAAMSRLYNGQTGDPPSSALIGIARAYNVSLDWLARGLSLRLPAPSLDDRRLVYTDDPADQLINWLEMAQTKARLTLEQRIQEAYMTGVRDGYTPEQFERLDMWRNVQLLERDTENGSDDRDD